MSASQLQKSTGFLPSATSKMQCNEQVTKTLNILEMPQIFIINWKEMMA